MRKRSVVRTLDNVVFQKPDRSNPMPLWAQITSDLRDRLAQGEFTDGFPPERELIEQYEVSRHTMREAMRRLHSEGLIERERGRGTFLRPKAIQQEAGNLYSLFRSIEDQGFEQRSQVLQFEERQAPEIAEELSLPAATTFVYLQRLRNADSTPIATDEIWLPSSIAAPLLGVDFSRTAVYAELDRLCGVRPGSGWERIKPILASTEERRLLQLNKMEPAFLVERMTRFNLKPLEWRRTVIRGDMYSFLTVWGEDQTSATQSFSPVTQE